MQIIRRCDLQPRPVDGENSSKNPLKSCRVYYLPQGAPLEIIETHMPPDFREKQAHAHEKIREATLVLNGEVIVSEIAKQETEYRLAEAQRQEWVRKVRDGELKEILEKETGELRLLPGDFCVFDSRSCHMMKNASNKHWALTLTFKFKGETKDVYKFLMDKHEPCDKPLPRQVCDIS